MLSHRGEFTKSPQSMNCVHAHPPFHPRALPPVWRQGQGWTGPEHASQAKQLSTWRAQVSQARGDASANAGVLILEMIGAVHAMAAPVPSRFSIARRRMRR